MEIPGSFSAYSVAAIEEAIPTQQPRSVLETAGILRGRAGEPEPVSASSTWRPLTRVGFRIAFIYFILFMYLFGNDSNLFTRFGTSGWFTDILKWPLNYVGMLAGRHIFHLTDVSNWRVMGRGDGLINWVLNGVFLAGSVIGGLMWTAIAHLRRSRRTEYQTLLAWLRFFLRLTVGFFMVGYGMLKIFPLQMGPIPVAVLNQPFGQVGSTTLFWSMMGLRPVFESICGVVEATAGTLVLFRRTALLGALLSIFLMTNVVLYDFFYHVPVLLFAVNLLLAAVFIVLPDAQPLLNFFWRHQPTVQTGTWVPPAMRRGVRIYVRALEIIFIGASLIVIPFIDGAIWSHRLMVAHIQSPLIGAWRLDSMHPDAKTFVTPKGTITELYIDNLERAVGLTADGTLWANYLHVDNAAHTMFFLSFYSDNMTYRWELLDLDHLVLTSMPPAAPAKSLETSRTAKPASEFTPVLLTFTRIPLPNHYRLLEPMNLQFFPHGAAKPRPAAHVPGPDHKSAK